MRKTTHGFLNRLHARRKQSCRVVAGWLILAVCGLGSLTLHAKPMTDAAIAARTIRSDDAGVVLQVRTGDSLRDIAQYYSRKHNIPFQKTYDLLIQTNQAQLPGGDPNRMQVGAQIVLPSVKAVAATAAATPATTPEQAPTPPTTQATTAAINAAPVTAGSAAGSTSTVAVNEQANSTPAAVSPAPSAPPAANNNATAEPQSAASQVSVTHASDWLQRVPKSLWTLLAPVLLLCLGVAYLMRRPRSDDEEQHIVEAGTRSVHTPSVGETISTESVTVSDSSARPVVQEVDRQTVQTWFSSAAELKSESDLTTTGTLAVSQDKAVVEAEVSPESVRAEVLNEPAHQAKVQQNTVEAVHSAAHISPVEAETLGETEVTEILPEAAEEIQHRFKQALHGLTADQLDLRKPASDATAAIPNAASGAAATSIASSRLNVNHLLRQYADHTLDKAGQVNYYALAERTRLQKWMGTQSEDDLLTHAQKAYGEGYPNVAHHILNEVLLRGNVVQSTRALDLRNEWHLQTLRQNAQQNEQHTRGN